MSPARAADDAEAPLARTEARLRALHELRVEARLRPDFEPHYVAFVRSLREQLHPRGVRDVRSVEVADGLRFSVDLGDRLGCDVFYGYYDERFEASLFAAVLKPGDTMLDVGANFGYYAITCGRAVGPGGTVHAFEPDPDASDLLTANAEVHGLVDTLVVHRLAVSDQDGEIEYHLAKETAFSGLRPTGRSAMRGKITVPMRSLDSIATERGIRQVDAVKIDVEGHEAAVLRGAADLIHRSPDPLVMLEVSAKNLTDATRLELIAALGSLFALGFHGLLPDLCVKGGLRSVKTADEAAGLFSANLLLVRAGRERERTLRDAVAERLGDAGPLLEVRPAEEPRRPVRLTAGLDPDLVVAALRDKADAEGRAAMLAAEAGQLRAEIAGLRTERAALRAEVGRLSRTPTGLAVRAARRLARWLSLDRQ
jgi:FkbM family methyltransferase